ncbi:CHAT domain-containing protein [Brevundimonas subvibrioides]|uniref:CHAT domain-containing protein n=1 Tax=Brevundimonas subvibrioides TaxID=74313 RepID=UPI0022B34704|nr:CHAT domain-containing tetratricopeptide repeat protein [Brevundimonas subvibrioides]
MTDRRTNAPSGHPLRVIAAASVSAIALALHAGGALAQVDQRFADPVAQATPAQPVIPPAIRPMTAEEKTQYEAWVAEALAATNERRFDEAQRLLTLILDIEQRTLGPDHPEAAGILGWMANNLNAQGQYREAWPLYERALRITEAALGPDHPTTANRLNNLALNLNAQGRYAEARPLHERALRIREAALGPDHPDTAQSLNNLALNLGAQGQYAEARPLYERALRITEVALGPDHPDTADGLNNLAANLNDQGLYAEAQPLNERALRIREARLGPDHPDTAQSLNNLANNLSARGQYGEARPLLERVLSITEATLGPDHPDTATSLNNLAANLNAQGQYAEARRLLERALRINEAAFGPDHPSTAISLHNLASNLNARGLYADAQPLYERALRIREAALGPDHPDTAGILDNLSQNLKAQGLYAEARPLLERALRIKETALGVDHPDTATSLNNLAFNLNALGLYVEAQPLFERALRIREAALGPDHPDTADGLSNLAANLDDRGLYADAQPLHERALRIREAALGPDHPDTAASLSNLALNLDAQGLYTEAQPLYERALRIAASRLGPDHPDIARGLNNLAYNLNARGRYGEARPLFERALRITEAALGPDHPDTATSLNNLAANLNAQGQFAEARRLLERALRINEAALGPEHPRTALGLNNLAFNLNAQGLYADAQPLYERALTINETALGPDHPDTARSLNNLAENIRAQGRYTEAQPRFNRAIGIWEAALGPDHPTTALGLNNLAVNLIAQGLYAEARPLNERGLRITEAALGPSHPTTAGTAENTALAALGSGAASDALTPARQALEIRRTVALREGGNRDEASQVRLAGATGTAAVIFTRAAWSVDRSGAGDDALRAEAFQAVQWQEGSSAGRAQVRAAARRALSPAGQALAREWETALEERAGLDRQFSAAAGGTDEAARTRQADLVRRRDTLDARITDLTTQLERDYPQYLELLNPSSLSVADLQPLLHESEALVLVSPGDARMPEGQRRGIVFVVTREGFDWAEVGMEPDDLEARIGVLRDELKPDGGRGPDSGGSATVGQGGRGFDRSRAYELYQALFGDERIAALLADKEDWILSPQGSLLSLPFAALPMAEPVGDDADPRALIDTPWLGTTRALSVLPNLSTLRQVRGEDRREAPSAPDPFRGFGFATYNAGRTIQPEEGRFLTRAQLRANRVRTLDPLDSTGDELFAIAAALGDEKGETLSFQTDATEARVKALSDDGTLARARVIAFATHGLIPPELGLDQAALAFSPPGRPEGDDDGLLTAAEAAGLRLNADWVILSACNTASSDQDAGSEALAGLARAFFFAGARSLLVSHWKVGDTDATALTTSAVRLQQQDPALSRARAMQQSMQDLMQNPNTAHPTHWAPFILVGAE